jgi:hypothetical protein
MTNFPNFVLFVSFVVTAFSYLAAKLPRDRFEIAPGTRID